MLLGLKPSPQYEQRLVVPRKIANRLVLYLTEVPPYGMLECRYRQLINIILYLNFSYSRTSIFSKAINSSKIAFPLSEIIYFPSL